MGLTGTKTFVGFGFGAIQSGLFLYEAFQSGNFNRLVVSEVMSDLVSAVRVTSNQYFVNIAFTDRVDKVQIGPIEIFDPNIDSDRQKLINAVAEADEIATAVPSVKFYTSEKESSLHRIIARGLEKKIIGNKKSVVIYAAENHNHAAEILEMNVLGEVREEIRNHIRSDIRFINTVIGKMSQVVVDPIEINARGLSPITPHFHRAFLVESFNRILISKIDFSEPFKRGIDSLTEKKDLLPFEEAKLYGHNATHALAGYIGRLCNAELVTDLKKFPGVINFLRAAFIEESGTALIRKYDRIDPLFTREGYTEYADDLITRMFNPFLMDSIDRVTRDTGRKLDWNDRLIGTLRLAIHQGVEPYRYAFGVAAAISSMDDSYLGPLDYKEKLSSIWGGNDINEQERQMVFTYIDRALIWVKKWKNMGFPDLEEFVKIEIPQKIGIIE